jgi:Chlamydia polymorphic membrane protein (Chlamydia_PMP) repeat
MTFKKTLSNIFSVLIITTLILTAMPAQPAQAAAITVSGCTATELINAISTSNGTAADDTIELNGTCTYTLTAIDNSTWGDSGLPIILNATTVGELAINGNGATITRDGNAPQFRIFFNHSGGNLTLDSVTLTDGDSSGDAGGILNWGTLNIVNSTISGNSATDYGGGIWSAHILNITNSTLSGNSATDGGGILIDGGAVTISNSTLSGNSVIGSGGGILHAGAQTLTINNSTFSGNSAVSGGGGGIRNGGTITLIINSTFSGNTTGEGGGGIYNGGTITTIINSTFSGNSAISGGGGIYNAVTLTNITNTIIANNTVGNCSGVPTGTKNITDSTGCSSWTDTSLVPAEDLGPLASNGGPTQTIALLGTSATNPAIDTGFSQSCSGAYVNSLDQRGVTRPQGEGCDIGAYELKLFPWPMFLPAVTNKAD